MEVCSSAARARRGKKAAGGAGGGGAVRAVGGDGCGRCGKALSGRVVKVADKRIHKGTSTAPLSLPPSPLPLSSLSLLPSPPLSS